MKNIKTQDLTIMALFVVIIEICTHIKIPSTVPFTMQTFAVFTALLILGGRKGLIAIITYILLFKFTGLLSLTGGYLLGFIAIAIIYMIFEKNCNSDLKTIVTFVIGNLVCYIFGTLWFVHIYTQTIEPISFSTSLSICVIPFVIPDLIKIILAIYVSKRVKKYI